MLHSGAIFSLKKFNDEARATESKMSKIRLMQWHGHPIHLKKLRSTVKMYRINFTDRCDQSFLEV